MRVEPNPALAPGAPFNQCDRKKELSCCYRLLMQLDRLHKNRVGMTEILELAVNFVGPLHTVKEIVPKAIHYDQQRSRDLSKVLST